MIINQQNLLERNGGEKEREVGQKKRNWGEKREEKLRSAVKSFGGTIMICEGAMQFAY